jgi:hypothetical protein
MILSVEVCHTYFFTNAVHFWVGRKYARVPLEAKDHYLDYVDDICLLSHRMDHMVTILEDLA